MLRKWLWPVGAVALLLVGMVTVSVLALEPAEQGMAVQVRNLAEVSSHPVPEGVRAETTAFKAPTAIWVVREGDTWLALSNQLKHPRACPVAWDSAEQAFIDPCLGSVFDRQGRPIAGPPPQGLDAYPVTITSTGWIEIDLSHPEPAK
jgi:Rieske Fe-S protein